MSALTCLAITTAAVAVAVVPSHATAREGQHVSALSLVPELAVRAAVGPAYNRDHFHQWTDDDGDCRDTYQEVLARDSLVPVTLTADGCSVVAGQWSSAYAGQTQTDAADVGVDHLVPLSEAWYSGASTWDPGTRQRFANDLGLTASLVTLTRSLSESRGASDPDEWLPPATDAQCQYASEWVRVKYRWGLSVDATEQAKLLSLLSGECQDFSVIVPAMAVAVPVASTPEPTPEPTPPGPLFKHSFDGTIYKQISGVPYAISYEEWREVYRFRPPQPTATDYVKYPWSPTVYAVTFWTQDEASWQWTALDYNQYRMARFPKPRAAGWIQGSRYYKWGTSPELFVEGADGVKHKLTGAEWAASRYRAFVDRANEGVLKLSWAPELAWMSNISTGQGTPLNYPRWQGEALPTPRTVARINGDQFYQNYGSSTIWYAGPGMNRPVTYSEWVRAGSPSFSVRGAPPVYPFTNVKATATSVVLYGDSQLDGDSWSEQGARALGFTDQASHFSYGGIGYSTSSPSAGGTGWTAVQQGRVPFPGGSPGLVLVSLGGNDASAGRSDAQVIADSSALWAKLKLMYPQSRIIINGVMSRNDVSHNQRRHIDDVLAANAARQGVTFVSVAGLASAANAQYLDNVHMSQAGHDAVAPLYTARLAAALKR